MRRREFLGLLGGAAAAWPLEAQAQELGRIYRIGFLLPGAKELPATMAFFDEMRLHGFVEGQNLAIIPGGFAVRDEQLAEAAAALVKAEPDAIIAGPERQIQAVLAVTRTIPVIGMTEDMVAGGFAASLARPGGNVTGVSLLSPELDGKRQGLLIEAVPSARLVAVFADAVVTRPGHLQMLQETAAKRGVTLSPYSVSLFEQVLPALEAAKASGAQAVQFLTGPLFGVPGSRNGRLIIERLASLRFPAIHQWPETADEGGLIAYGARFTEVFRQRARMVVKVLRGAKPTELPVEQPTRFELVINLKTAQAIGHEVPAALVLRADKVIE
jgi:putative ABC transport system substrate-binding protein